MDIKLEGVSFSYERDEDSPLILNNIGFELKSGEVVGIVGPTGSGKTTLIELTSGFHKPILGNVYYNGTDIYSEGFKKTEIRRMVSIVFQFPEKQLFEDTVFDDVAFAARNMGMSDERIEEITRESIKLVGLDYEKVFQKSPFEMSGGEQRRVAIAGVLATKPEIVFMDEPTVAIDFYGLQCVERDIESLHSKGKTIVIVSHNMDLIAKTTKRVIALNKGSVVFDGDTEGFFNNERLINSLNLEMPEFLKLIRKYNIKTEIQGFRFDLLKPILEREIKKTVCTVDKILEKDI